MRHHHWKKSSAQYREPLQSDTPIAIFNDLKQAFDNLTRSKVNNALKELKMPKKLRNLITVTMGRIISSSQTKDHILIGPETVFRHFDQQSTIFNKSVRMIFPVMAPYRCFCGQIQSFYISLAFYD